MSTGNPGKRLQTVHYTGIDAHAAVAAHMRVLFKDTSLTPTPLPVQEPSPEDGGGYRAVFLSEPDADMISRTLGFALNCYVELGQAEQLPAELAELSCDNDLVMALTSKRAFDLPVGKLFTAAILTRSNQADPAAKTEPLTMELAVHEAYSNGLIHGNLEIGSELRNDLRAYDAFTRQLDTRLNDPAYGGRYILLAGKIGKEHLTVTIHDQGKGYAGQHTSDDEDRKHGRGLEIIREAAEDVVISHGGRRIALVFRRTKQEVSQ